MVGWALLLCMVSIAAAVDERPRGYKDSEKIHVLATKVGPFHNPTETYSYLSLPLCHGGEVDVGGEEIGDHFAGRRVVRSGFSMFFGKNSEFQEACELRLRAEDVEALKKATEEEYFFEFLLDDLPMYGYVGSHEADEVILGKAHDFLYTFFHFRVHHNGGYIISAELSTDPARRTLLVSPSEAVRLGSGSEAGGVRGGAVEGGEGAAGYLIPEVDSGTGELVVRVGYSVEWVATEETWEVRHDRQHNPPMVPADFGVHWLSILNSAVVVVLMLIFIGVVFVRVLRSELGAIHMLAAAGGGGDDFDAELEDKGWKVLWGDVFRPPQWATLLSALVGAGMHLLLASSLLLGATLLGVVRVTRRGAILTSFIACYCLAAPVGGYVASRLFQQMRGKQNRGWVWNILLTAVIFPLPLLLVFSYVNTLAFSHQSTAALPFPTILVVLTLYAVLAVPLTVVAGLAARSMTPYTPPCKPNQRERSVQPQPWFRSSAVTCFVCGFIPFTSISIELYYIFAAMWGHHVYTLFGILGMAFALVVLVTAFVVIIQTWLQLTSEDHRWWWRAFLAGAAAGVFIFAYAAFYFFAYSEMSGVLQTSMFFGYMAIIAYAFALMLGAVGFLATFAFVDFLYSHVKVE